MAGHIFKFHLNFPSSQSYLFIVILPYCFKLFTCLSGQLGRDALSLSWLCMPLAHHITFLEAQDPPPPPSFGSLGLLDKSKLLCSAFKALQDVVLAQRPSLSAHYCPPWCSSSTELLRASRTHLCTFAHAVPSTWRALPTAAHLASSRSSFKPFVVQRCPCVTSSLLPWPWVPSP